MSEIAIEGGRTLVGDEIAEGSLQIAEIGRAHV